MRVAVVMVGSCLLVVAAGLLLRADTAAGARAPGRTASIVLIDRGGATVATADGSAREGLPWVLPGDGDIAVSPDGRRIAFSSARDGNREIYLADGATGALVRLTTSPRREDVTPAWSPNGRRLVWASGTEVTHDLWTVSADGRGKRLLLDTGGDDVEPDWAPAGGRIVFASDADGRYRLWAVGVSGLDAAPLGDLPGQARRPAWHPDGDRIAYTGVVSAAADVWVVDAEGLLAEKLVAGPGFEGRPSWSQDGATVAFLRGRGELHPWRALADGSAARRLSGGPAGAVELVELGPELAPRPGALLPDLDQRPPANLVIRSEKGRVWLGFASAVDNRGRGALRIRGTRAPGAETMRADQIVELRGGRVVVRRNVGQLRFESHPPHHHWHLQPFDRYELRGLDGTLLRTDRKTGFCLLDRWGLAPLPPGVKRGPPRFLGSCARERPDARSVEEGSSVGYTDRYPEFFHGQEVDLTDVPAGRYVVVHRANPERRMRELTYANNVASVLVRLRRPRGVGMRPTVEVLRACDGTDRCAP